MQSGITEYLKKGFTLTTGFLSVFSLVSCVDSYPVFSNAAGILLLTKSISPGDSASRPAAGFDISPAEVITSESGTTAIITIKITSPPASDVTIDFISENTSEGTITSGSSLTFNRLNYSNGQNVAVQGTDDLIADGTQTYSITGMITTADPEYSLLGNISLSALNMDDESPGIIMVSPENPLQLQAEGAVKKLYIAASAEPSADVTVNISSSDTVNGGTVSPSSVTFTSADWSAKEITVTPVSLPGAYSNPFTINFSNTSSTAANWNNLDVADANAITTGFELQTCSVASASVPYSSISGTGTAISFTGTADDGYQIIPIGFNFTYLGNTFTQAGVDTNGYITFDPAYSVSGYYNEFLFAAAAPASYVWSAVLAPWWDDLTTASSTVFFQTDGTSPNRVFTVEWAGIERLTSLDTFNFQVKLYEPGLIIEFHYGPSSIGSDGTNASAGISDFIGGTDYRFLEIDGNRLLPGNELRSFADFPPDGTVYKFSCTM